MTMNTYKRHAAGSMMMMCMFLAMATTSCRQEVNEGDEVDDMVERCWDYAQKNPDGFTIDIRSFEAPSQGIVVSYAATQNSFDKKDLHKVVMHALSHANLVGGWLNEANHRYYFDSDTLFDESMLNEALKWGKENGQQSVFILSEMKNVDIEY